VGRGVVSNNIAAASKKVPAGNLPRIDTASPAEDYPSQISVSLIPPYQLKPAKLSAPSSTAWGAGRRFHWRRPRRREEGELTMCKTNFTKRQAALRSRMQAIEDQLRSEADISASARLEAECDRLCDEIVALEQCRPRRSSHPLRLR
jgi:hypothetical protein